MRFRGLLRGNDPDALDDWIREALGCGIHAMQKFARRCVMTSTQCTTRSTSRIATAKQKGTAIASHPAFQIGVVVSMQACAVEGGH